MSGTTFCISWQLCFLQWGFPCSRHSIIFADFMIKWKASKVTFHENTTIITKKCIMELFNLGVIRHLPGGIMKLTFSLRIPSTNVMLGHLNPSFRSVSGYSFIHFYSDQFAIFSLLSQKLFSWNLHHSCLRSLHRRRLWTFALKTLQIFKTPITVSLKHSGIKDPSLLTFVWFSNFWI